MFQNVRSIVDWSVVDSRESWNTSLTSCVDRL